MKDELLLKRREESFYDWGNQLDSVKSKLRIDTDAAILVSAPFGGGKSSFTNILMNELKEKNSDDWLISIVEIWRYELLGPDTIIQRLIYDLIEVFFKETALKKIGKTKQESLKVFLKEYQFINKNVVKEYGEALVNAVLKEYAHLSLEEIKKIHKSPFARKLKELSQLVKNDYLDAIGLYSTLLKEIEKDLSNNRKILFIFRDCDRVNPENLLKIVDCIYHINISNKVKFIIEADEKTIKSILSSKYNLGDYYQMIKPANRTNFKDHLETINGYLDKIFDTIINVERSNLNKLKISQYISGNFLQEFAQDRITFSNFTSSYDTNFRFIKRKISLELKPIIEKELSKLDEFDFVLNALIVLYLYNELNSQKFRNVFLPKVEFFPQRVRNSLQYKFDEKSPSSLFSVANPPSDLFTLGAEGACDYFNSLSLIVKKGTTGATLFNFAQQDFEGRQFVDIQEELNQIITTINTLWEMLCGNP